MTYLPEIERVTVDELKSLLDGGRELTLLDARAEGAYDSSDVKVKGSIRMPVAEIEGRLSELDKKKAVVVYCT